MTGYHLLKYANDNMSYTGDSSNDLPVQIGRSLFELCRSSKGKN